ncbi:MAG TPA: geranylgeranylglycerol-phosphate geranylgeranyltransferase [Nitrososphaerales archaeon]|nr:geranylgeranylglycerol-phosphate geranylgeranyltransferase [Nitrososphaerales archaeon]
MNPRAGLAVIRPVNCAMMGFAVVVGEFVSKPAHILLLPTAFGFLTGFFLCGYSMIVNDIYDLEVDRVNQPERPLPSGRLSVQGAVRLSLLMLLAGVAFTVLSLNAVAVAIALLFALLSWLYSAKAKKAGLAGNLIVASSLAIPFIYGGVIGNGSIFSSLLLMMAFTSFFAGVGREIVKAMADVEGDQKRGIRSVAMVRGMGAAAASGAALFLAAVLTSWLPLALGLANEIYLVGVVVPDAIFLYLAASIVRNRDPSNAHRVKRIALMGMLTGLLVFIGGAL